MNEKYKDGKIYKITHIDNEKIIYIGSTIETLNVRYSGHRKDDTCSFYKYVKNNYECNYALFKIELIELYPCNSKKELELYEGTFIKKYKNQSEYTVINMRIAGRSKKQWAVDNIEHVKEHKKEYREKNSEKLKEKNKEYYQNNKELLNVKNKIYALEHKEQVSKYKEKWSNNNKDKLKEIGKNYYENNKDKILRKVKCEYCNCEISNSVFNRHLKSFKHISNMQNA